MGTGWFFDAELQKVQAGVDIVKVAYRGGGEALTAVISGETSVYFPPLSVGLPHMRQGRVRALALTSAARVQSIPELPTIAESYPGYESVNWNGLVVPANTPRETLNTIRSAATAVLNSPAINKRLIEMHYQISGNTSEQFASYIAAEIAMLAKLIKQTGISAD